jgi:hypothetical protein
MCAVNLHVNWFEMSPVLAAEAAACHDIVEGRHPSSLPKPDDGFNLERLQAIVGNDPVATPYNLPLPVEESLRASGQYTPSFYEFPYVTVEDLQIDEFNRFKWALIPEGGPYVYVERPENLYLALGIQFPYRTRRPVYTVGLRFTQNLTENWKLRGKVGDFLVYEHK